MRSKLDRLNSSSLGSAVAFQPSPSILRTSSDFLQSVGARPLYVFVR